eukprot:CAMPEP_0202894296 /NCGR_PEP_ID=MMETSP1392-20130828/3728_1 /ASSEMBLY_ACC=CAM_ASM_000868 /TAXON_ID=225041 /ORGANISM="Chlamydomonas chlamydogama, Strain SAG 11-48b" /LENGTH=205 /DNA_ID=CAMNT_0049578947 /DNA_START=139 /DNA_END=757 /DNA_ORIENTATION=-
MANQRVSLAQFEDFPLKERKHFTEARGNKSSLGPGMAISDESNEASLPHHLNRTRIAHDAADLYTAEDSFASTTQRQDAGASMYQTSYQAMQAGTGDNAARRTGKRCVQPTNTQRNTSGLANFVGGGPLPRPKDDPTLQLGTTKNSPHVPGYTGHIPKTNAPNTVAARDPNSKTLVIENFRPYAGYTDALDDDANGQKPPGAFPP